MADLFCLLDLVAPMRFDHRLNRLELILLIVFVLQGKRRFQRSSFFLLFALRFSPSVHLRISIDAEERNGAVELGSVVGEEVDANVAAECRDCLSAEDLWDWAVSGVSVRSA